MPRAKQEASRQGRGRSWSWVAYLLCSLAALLLIQVTVPAFQQERALARELTKAMERRNKLEELREAYELRARALQEDPQERFRFYLELHRLGQVR